MISADELRELTLKNRKTILEKERQDLEELLRTKALSGKYSLEIEHISQELQEELKTNGLRPMSTMIPVVRGSITMMAAGFSIVW